MSGFTTIKRTTTLRALAAILAVALPLLAQTTPASLATVSGTSETRARRRKRRKPQPTKSPRAHRQAGFPRSPPAPAPAPGTAVELEGTIDSTAEVVTSYYFQYGPTPPMAPDRPEDPARGHDQGQGGPDRHGTGWLTTASWRRTETAPRTAATACAPKTKSRLKELTLVRPRAAGRPAGTRSRSQGAISGTGRPTAKSHCRPAHPLQGGLRCRRRPAAYRAPPGASRSPSHT